MDLSIIIVSFNTKDLTTDCIESVTKSKPKLKYEVIVVDNGSTDRSVEKIEKLIELSKSIKLIKNKSNSGFSKANNQGIKMAKGKYVLLLNSDTVVKKGALDELVKFAKKNSDVGVVGARLLNPSGSIQGSVFEFPTIKRTVGQYWFGKKGLLDKYAPRGKKPLRVEVLSMACLLITPKCLTEVGLLEEKYFMYFEDLDYCRRVQKSSLGIYYLPSVEVVHHHGASGKNIVGESEQWRRLIPSSKIYHGIVKHSLISFIMWSGQKLLGHK